MNKRTHKYSQMEYTSLEGYPQIHNLVCLWGEGGLECSIGEVLQLLSVMFNFSYFIKKVGGGAFLPLLTARKQAYIIS